MKIKTLLLLFLEQKSHFIDFYRIMKVSFFLLFVCVCQLFATNTKAQNTTINIQANTVSIGQLISEIEKQTDFLVVFSNREVDLNREVKIQSKSGTVFNFLNNAFDKTDISYGIENSYIILSKQKASVAGSLVGQQDSKPITGVVKDKHGETIIGANIRVGGTSIGTITDVDGKFSLNVPPNGTLIVSYIGFITKDIPIKNQKMLTILLDEDMQALEEVVVIGYGTAKKKDLTGAISTIKTGNLEKEAPRSVQDLLRANSAGLNIAFATGPSADVSLQVRGKNTLKAGSSPLIVLDGVIYEGALSDINPMDIASVDVLKDASSSAVYGAKAANGVVVVSTKRGQSGKPVINFNTNLGFVTSANQREILDGAGFVAYRQDYERTKNSKAYLEKYPEIFSDPRKLESVNALNWYNYDQKTPVSSVTDDQLMRTWLSRLDFKAPEIENYMSGNETRWDDLVFQTGLQQDYTASISNRKEDFSYYWSMGYMDNEGIMTGDRYTTFRTRLNLESKITNFLTVGINTNFSTRDESKMTSTSDKDPYKACEWQNMVRISPYGSNNIDDLDSQFRRLPTGDVTPVNPFYDNLYRDRMKRYNTLNSNIYAKITLPYGIEYQMNFIPHYRWDEYYLHESSQNEEWKNKGGSSERSTSKTFNWQIDNVIRWKREFNKAHNIEVTLLANAEKGQYWSQKAKASSYSPNDYLGYHRLESGAVPTVSSEDTYKTGDALMARLFYSYKGKYMVTASVRRDGYSAFGQRNPRATFPAVALGWAFTSEKFMEPISHWLNYGKLRLSWGENGNRDIGQYEALSDLTTGPYPYIDQSGSLYLSSLLYVNRMANRGLKWERTGSYNIGLDFSLFNDILSGSAEGYISNTNDLLVDRALPEILGFSSVTSNLGQIRNKGFEFTLNANIMKTKNFEWTASANFSLNRRTIKKLYGDMVNVTDASGNVIGQKEADDIKNKWFIGQDPDRIWDYERTGVWQEEEEKEAAKYGCQPGDFKFTDQNKDGVMTDADKILQKYKTPRFRWTLRNEFRVFNDFSLSFMMYSLWGQYASFGEAANKSNFPDRCSAYVQPHWMPENRINDFARINSKSLGDNYISRSFIRLDNITVAYSVPQELLKKISVQNMRFSLSVRNVGVFSPDWKYWDPETGGPTPRTFNLGINFTL